MAGKEIVMLEKYFRRLETLDQIRASWIGPGVERYVAWLDEHHYAARVVFARVPTVMHFGRFAAARGAKTWADLPAHVDAFVTEGPTFINRRRRTALSRRRMPGELRTTVEQFLRLVVPDFRGRGRARRTRRPFAKELPSFFDYLTQERGLCKGSIYSYECYLTAFEVFLGQSETSLRDLQPSQLVRFVEGRSDAGLRKPSVASVCGCLRTLLRYAHRQRALPRDLSATLDTPLLYKLSTVPRSIPWDDVVRLVRDVDRRDAAGKRDYALLLLLVTYGMRVTEVAALTLDDIDWQHSRLHVRQRKIGNTTGYPLTDAVGEALLDYIRHARPATDDRHVFLRAIAPPQPVNGSAISSRMRRLLARAGIHVVRPGGQVFRHTCVQRLVDTDVSFKTIADYVGHRSTLAQGNYAKVSVEALRDVALGDGEAVL
jgi:integrase/recombinase XerD